MAPRSLVINAACHTGRVLLQPADIFVRLIDEHLITCGHCGHRDGYSVPVVLDWRDYEIVTLLATCCPTVQCSGCAQPVALDTPIVVLRPGDPIRWLLSQPSDTPAERDLVAARKLVQIVRAMAIDIPSDPPVRIPHAELVGIAGRYSGFALGSMSYDGKPVQPPETADWFDGVRSQVVTPNVAEVLFNLLCAADEKEVLQVYEAHPVLLDPAWAPVFAAFSRRVLATLESPEAVQLTRYRLVQLNRRRWPHDPVPAESLSEFDAASRAVLSRAHDPALNTAERRVVFDEMVQLIEELPERRPFLAEELHIFFVQISRLLHFP